MAKTEEYDVVVIGAGHNGLIVAAYLAKAGMKVCVVEGQDKVGGGVITREVTLPGFKHDIASVMHCVIQANPLIHQDELKLVSKYNLKYINPDLQLAVIFPDDEALIFYRDVDKTCQAISRFSEKDAESYRKFKIFSDKMLGIASVATFSPPPTWGTLMSFLDKSDEGREYIRMILSSSTDVADDWFENERMKVAMTRFATEVMVGPREKGTGNAMFFISALHKWGWGLPVGGSGALSDALAARLKDDGGTIKLSSTVTGIEVSGDVAKGVILASGEKIMARKAIIANINAKQLYLDMLPKNILPQVLLDKIKRIRPATFSAISTHYALNEAPKYKAGDLANQAVYQEIAPFYYEYCTTFDGFAYGIPADNIPVVAAASAKDPTRAPAGKHTLYLYNYEPYALRDGGAARWDSIKEEIADRVLETLRRHTTNMGDSNILARTVISPLDIERSNPAMIAGDIGHIGQFITQFMANRPIPGWGQYRTPVKGLYMSGASTHPGLGVVGGGRAAVQVVMEDLGIDFKKTVQK